MKIVLASTSQYRKAMLQRILPEFTCIAPNIDEQALSGEEPEKLAVRLATNKAAAIANLAPNALVIGSDQVAWLNGAQLEKPGNAACNIEQLHRCSGTSVRFFTGLSLLNTRTGKQQTCVETYDTLFRPLSQQQIENYVAREQAFDCAGGFKMEGLGISLFERISGDDPNTLIGLPLIQLISMLRNEGVDVLS